MDGCISQGSLKKQLIDESVYIKTGCFGVAYRLSDYPTLALNSLQGPGSCAVHKAGCLSCALACVGIWKKWLLMDMALGTNLRRE